MDVDSLVHSKPEWLAIELEYNEKNDFCPQIERDIAPSFANTICPCKPN
jgi:hypothetical protein